VSAIPPHARNTASTRDGACVRCGLVEFNLHHRQRRREGGHGVENLIALCGSGTTGCHGWAHANPEAARARGYIVPTWIESPADIPVSATSTRRGGSTSITVLPPSTWFLLREDGTRDEITETLAAELLSAFGLLARSVSA